MKKSVAINELSKKAGLDKQIVLLTKFNPVIYGSALMEEFVFKMDKHKNFYRYDPQEHQWRNEAEQFIRTRLRSNLMGEEQQKRVYVEEVVNYIKDLVYDENFVLESDPNIIPFRDKAFDISVGRFVDFKPEHYITNKLDIFIGDETKNLDWSIVDKFFEDCVGAQRKITLLELLAYTLYKGVPYQKLFFIHGPAKTGKSVFLELVERFLGEDNVCSVEPQNIQKDKYSVAGMWMKLANIVSDINYDALENVNQIKKLTGGDTISIRQMYKNPFPVKIYAKQIYSTNKLPVVKEKTNAWYRRVYLIPFNNVVSDDKRDPFILKKITEPKQIRALAIKCCQALRGLWKRDFLFTHDMNETEMSYIYEQLSNPILRFLKDVCVEGEDHWCFKYEFVERLNNWLRENQFQPYTKTQINDFLGERFRESKRLAPYNDKSYRVWCGFKFKSTFSFPNFPDFQQNKNKSNAYRGVCNPWEIGENGEIKGQLYLTGDENDS